MSNGPRASSSALLHCPIFHLCCYLKRALLPPSLFQPEHCHTGAALVVGSCCRCLIVFYKTRWDGCWGKKKMPKKKLPTKSTNSQLWIYVRMLSKTFQRWTCCKYRLIISTLTSFCIQNCEGSFRAFQAIFLFFSETSGLCFVINPECVSIH